MSIPKLPEISPSKSTRLAVRQPVKAIRYGGGYTLYLRHGAIDPDAKWAVHWSGLTATEGRELIQFFEGQKGNNAFIWTPPNKAKADHFICMEWSETPLMAGFINLDAVLIRQKKF